METMPLSSTSELSQPAREPEKRKSSWLRPIIYLLLIAAAGYATWRVYTNQKAAAQQTANQANALLNRPTPVQAVPVEKRPMPIFLTALGTVTPYMSVTVKARVSGELEPVKFTEGQQVKQGETIMVIDPKPYQAALDQAKGTLAHDEALLKNAQAEFRRYSALYAAGVVSKETLDTDESNQGQYLGAIESDKAAIETAELQLGWCYVQSPINGRIGLRLVDPGNIITANTTNLVIVNQFEPIAVYFTLPENELPQVLATLHGQEHLVAEAYDRGDTVKLATGKLLTADNQIDTTTGTDKLKAVFDNTDEKLFPNQFVNIHLVMEDRPDALVVPSAAIQTGAQGTFVWAVQPDNTVKIQPVKVALAEGQVTILDSGVSAGQPVVIDGADRLRPGGSVVVSAPRRTGQGTGLGSGPPSAQSGGPAAARGSGAAPAGGDAGKRKGAADSTTPDAKKHKREQQ